MDGRHALTKEAGAYVLLMRLALALGIGTLAPVTSPAGWYAYAGSAFGPSWRGPTRESQCRASAAAIAEAVRAICARSGDAVRSSFANL
jgi:hypothetical protein